MILVSSFAGRRPISLPTCPLQFGLAGEAYLPQASCSCSLACGERLAGHLAKRRKGRAVTPGNDDGPILIPATPPMVLEGESQGGATITLALGNP